MKKFNLLLIAVIIAVALVFTGANIFLISSQNSSGSRPYRVEVNRIEQSIINNGFDSISTEGLEYVTNIERLNNDNTKSFYNTNSDYIIRQIDGETYRFDYCYSTQGSDSILILNISLAIVSLVLFATIIFVKIKIINPFNKLTDLPYELSRGNLSIPLKESKGRYFGRFIWGMDLLRERLEEQKASELELQKDKKTLVLSISHDIKTPLGVIELYSKALEKDLYKDENKKKEIAVNITQKCDEIKKYVNEIIKASNEDFLKLEVHNSEFYLSEMINEINTFYKDKLDLLKTDFTVNKYCDCIIKGDIDRSIEILQNIMENAIKYGDGKKISVSFEQEEDCMIVSVSNNGCTLSENEIDHIFDSFWRGSNVGSNSGSGLGLYICRQLIKKMDGDIFASCSNGIMSVSVVFQMG